MCLGFLYLSKMLLETIAVVQPLALVAFLSFLLLFSPHFRLFDDVYKNHLPIMSFKAGCSSYTL